MVIVELDMELYIRFQGRDEACDEYLCIFKSLVKTIYTHVGVAVYYPSKTKRTLEHIMNKRGKAMNKVEAMHPE